MFFREIKKALKPFNAIASITLCVVIIAFLSFPFSQAQTNKSANNLIVLDGVNSRIDISSTAEYLVLNHTETIALVSSTKYESQWRPYANIGLSSSKDKDLWVRFTVKQESSANNWYLVAAWPLLEHIQLSVFNHGAEQWFHHLPQGQNHIGNPRLVDSRYFVFPSPFQGNETKTYYLNIRSNNLLAVPLSFWPGEALSKFSQIDTLLLGAFIGSLIIMILYNGSLALILKDKSYWYYCGYVASIIFYEVTITGLGAFYLWPTSEWMMEKSLLTAAVLSFMTATLFIRSFLELEKIGGILLWNANVVLFVWPSLFFLSFFVPSSLVEPLVGVASLLTCAAATWSGVVLWRQPLPTAKIFVIAWGILIISTIIFVLGVQDVLAFNTFTRYAQAVGFVIELVLLSVALAYRINKEIDEKVEAQDVSLILTKKVSEERRERLKAQMEILAVQRQVNDELETHVEERTEQLNEALNKLENANAELTKLSITDPLTKVHNRRCFDDTLINEYRRAARANQHLAVVMIDIDHFKQINDTYGHEVGDQCLILVAKALNNVIHRPGDMLARYGGEEFIYILPDSNEDEAYTLAERARVEIEQLEYQLEGVTITMTVSAGVAAWVPSVSGSHKQLLNSADTALYRAKNDGRNCVRQSSQPGKLAQA